VIENAGGAQGNDDHGSKDSGARNDAGPNHPEDPANAQASTQQASITGGAR
jgi:hypothetical protein